MNVKRWAASLLVVAACCTLSACGDSDNEGASPVATTASPAPPVPTPDKCSASTKPSSEVKAHVSPEVWDLPVPPSNPAINALPKNGEGGSRCGLTIQVVGNCGQPGSDGLRLKASGFTPSSLYQSTVYYPKGPPYHGAVYENWKFGGYGKSADDGTTPGWRWDCYEGQGPTSDPEGTYVLILEDVMTGNRVTATFKVVRPA